MEQQIKDVMKQAFYDLIEEKSSSNPPDFDWLVRLYVEIKERLMYYLKKGSPVHKEIDESFDVALFEQMIRADVFSPDSMVKLIEITFYWIKKLGAPQRDATTDAAKERVLQAPMQKIVVTFLKEVHICIEEYDKDMRFILTKKTPFGEEEVVVEEKK